MALVNGFAVLLEAGAEEREKCGDRFGFGLAPSLELAAGNQNHRCQDAASKHAEE